MYFLVSSSLSKTHEYSFISVDLEMKCKGCCETPVNSGWGCKRKQLDIITGRAGCVWKGNRQRWNSSLDQYWNMLTHSLTHSHLDLFIFLWGCRWQTEDAKFSCVFCVIWFWWLHKDYFEPVSADYDQWLISQIALDFLTGNHSLHLFYQLQSWAWFFSNLYQVVISAITMIVPLPYTIIT